MDNSLQYKAMRKLLMSLVKPKYDKIIDDIKVVALSQISDTPTMGSPRYWVEFIQTQP